jgi:AraC-like DNA-binding protein
MRGTVPRLADVAAELGLGARCLQMKLHDEGTTFQRLCDSVRKTLATEALADPRVTVHEVAFLVGFSEPSAFHRAFRRWTGMTPMSFRSKKSSTESQRRGFGL